ncbi:Hypothetical predicted protein, partial [Marmota monax]
SSQHPQKCAVSPRERAGGPGPAVPPRELSFQTGLCNGHIKNDCGNKVLLAIWSNRMLSGARRMVADGCQQMWVERGSQGQ